jgi:hypothetical protein
MIKYSYARAGDNLVHINSITKESRKTQQYVCVECGERMAAHISGKRKKHFQHYNEPDHGFETYLHRTAKEIVYNTYLQALNDSKPVILEYREQQLCTTHSDSQSESCPWNTVIKEFDLTQTYRKIHLEHRIDGLQPDLYLKSDTEPDIYIEIFVTHKCEEEKINKGIGIIEIKIENEDDLERLCSLHFSCKDRKIRYVNFTRKETEGTHCTYKEYGCKKAFYYLELRGSWSYTIGIMTHEDILKRKAENGGRTIFARRCISGQEYAYEEFKDMFEEAQEKGLYLSSCTNCRYHEPNHHLYNTIYCNKLKIIPLLSHGQHCPNHKPEKSYF